MLETGPDLPVVPLAADVRTVGELFRERCIRSADVPAVYEKRQGTWWKFTWRDFYDRASRVAAGFERIGLKPGDRVAILGPTQLAWGVYDMGAQLYGLVSFGIYPKQSPEQIRYLLTNSGAKVVFVDGAAELANVLEAAKGLKRLKYIVPWTGDLAVLHAELDPRVTTPAEFDGAALSDEVIAAKLARRDPNETAILVYTSGTTGPPKGAMISNRNIISMLTSQDVVSQFRQNDISLSFLPMAHVAERILAFYGRIDSGMATAYASSIAAVLDELKEVQPTLFGSVPRIFEKAYAKIQTELEGKPPAVRKLFAWADDVGRRKIRLELAGKAVPVTLRLQYAVADRLVFQRVRAAFGGRVKQFITGAAPIAVEILEFFWAAGLPVYECYGMTEATVVTHANRPGEAKLGTVGRQISGIQVRIADDGEILIAGPIVFQGYWKRPDATAEAIVDGWLHTGDIGSVDDEGYLKITDRKKHLIITAGGKNVSPANIENAIKNTSALISQVHAHGDRRPYISALVAPSPIETLEFGVSAGVLDRADVDALTRKLMADPTSRSQALNDAMSKVVTLPAFGAKIAASVQSGNRSLAQVERVRRFFILDRDFSQEQGELTPTMKVKRKALEVKFDASFDRVYNDSDFAISVAEN